VIKALLKESSNERITKLSLNRKTKLIRNEYKKSTIHVVYVMSNTSICGAAKIIFQQANEWVKKGKKVTIVAYGRKPTWFPINCSYISVPAITKLATCIPYCDLIIATYYTHIGECVKTGIAPVAYFEQGDYHLFAYDELGESHKAFLQSQYSLAHYILTVSREVAKYIKQLFNREAIVIHNGIDTTLFHHRTWIREHKKEDYLLIVGNDQYAFKGIPDMIAAYKIIKEELPHMKLYWITPESPTIDVKDVTKVIVAPNQDDIPSIYQQASLYMQGSYYEAFGLPILEAMACGCPVLTTDCIGMRDYVSHNQNAIVLKSHSPMDIAEQVMHVMNNYKIRRKIVAGGLKTARKFRWKKICKMFMNIIEHMAVYQIEPNQTINAWDIHIHGEDFLSKEGYTKFLQYLKTTEYREIFVPAIYDVSKDFSIARWESVAKRRDGGDGSGYCYTKVKKRIKDLEDHAIGQIYQHINRERYEEALKDLEQLISTYHKELIYKRWLIYCLIQLEAYDKALQELDKTPIEGTYTDYDYLYCLVYKRLGKVSRVQEMLRKIETYQEAIIYDEFIVNIVDEARRMNGGTMEEQFALPKQNKEGNQLSMEEIYDFAMQLYDNGLYDDGIYYFLEFVKEEKEDTEKCIDAYRKIYLSYYYKENYEVCRKYCYQTFDYTLPRAEECCFIGYTFMKEKKFNEAIFWYELAADIKLPRNYKFSIDKAAWSWKPYLQLCVCYYEKGDTEKAFKANEKARELNPHDKSILQNVTFFESKGYASFDD